MDRLAKTVIKHLIDFGLMKKCGRSQLTMSMRPRTATFVKMLAVLMFSLSLVSVSGNAQRLKKDDKPYDQRLMRLSEILGAVHYLRELCQSGDDQLWRQKMQDLMKAEGSSALRRARLTRSFNRGYRSYQRTYNVCTPSAKTTIDRFLIEGVQIGEELFRAYPK